MFKLGFYNYYNVYNKNRIFIDIPPIGEDLLFPFRKFKELAENQGISVSTIDTEPLESYDAIIFLDFPTYKNEYFSKLIENKFKNMYLFIFENELVRPDNWKRENYRYFKKIFTWNDSLVDNRSIFKFFLPNKIPENPAYSHIDRKHFCCLISGNKIIRHPLELYSERISAIRWFESNAPGDFDLYGFGWDTMRDLNNSFFERIRNRIIYPRYPSYKGTVRSKSEVLRKYKFSICYENARDISGYITEKIFDCFFSYTIPVYWGAPDISRYIPEETFIDKRKFSTYRLLYDFMKNLTNDDYCNYIRAIDDFIKGPQIRNFSPEYFSSTIFEMLGFKQPGFFP